MVSWGQNTVHTVPANQNNAGGAPPAPSLTSSPSAYSFSSSSAPGGLFGSTNTPAPAPSGGGFGGFSSTPAAAPASTSLFGSAPTAAAPTTNLFGTAPATSTSLFGATTTPAPSNNLFGSTAPAAASGSTLFGGGPAQQQQQMPAQAALQAHMDASARQESERVKAKLEKIFLTYRGQATIGEGSDETSKFVAVTYNPMTPQEKQMQIMGRVTGSNQIMIPPRPPQVSPKEWTEACMKNKDQENYVPLALVGATALQGRLSWQQQRANDLSANTKSLQQNLEFLRNREIGTRQRLHEKERQYVALRNRLMEVMRKVEVVRSMNKPFQSDEYKAVQRLQVLLEYEGHMRSELTVLKEQARRQRQALQNQYANALVTTQTEDYGVTKEQIGMAMQLQQDEINKMTDEVKRDQQDVNLVGNRIVSAMPRSY